MKELIVNYWAQFTVVLGILGYIIKTVFDYKLKNKELKFRYYYDLKAKKIIELYGKIVELQMIVDRRKSGESPSFENNIFKHRIELDKYYWESSFYLSAKSERAFKDFLEYLKFFEIKQVITDNPAIEKHFEEVTKQVILEFKNEIV